jgi:putative ABC transport system substrate-binding protein
MGHISTGSNASRMAIGLPTNLWRAEMRRRQFIGGLAGVTVVPLRARAQQPALPAVGLLDLGPPRPDANYITAFRQGLAAAGFVEGRNVSIEYRWANNQGAQLAPLASELVQRKVAVIVTLDSGPTILAAKAATSTIPIVFALGSDPIKFGLVASLSRPGGNMTGVTLLSSELTGKRLELLHEIAPSVATIAYITDPRARNSEDETKEFLAAARVLGQQPVVLETRNALEIDAAFAILAERGAGALVVGAQVLFGQNARRVVELTGLHKMPAIYPGRGFAANGGLMSYTADGMTAFRLTGSLYAAQILRGAKPSDLPVQQPTKFELVINLKTAKTLGLAVPPNLLAIADEVIE